MTTRFVLLDSITDAGPPHAGLIAVSGSHGGLYPAAVASGAGLRAVLFNDAGIGREQAGVAGVMALDRVGMAAAAADGRSCKIGSAEDMLGSGHISVVNRTARGIGVTQGMSLLEALKRLGDAPSPSACLPAVAEARQRIRLTPGGLELLLVDSASLVRPEDAEALIVTGSHGGLIGGDKARALKAPARLAVFNDAGGGKDDVGFGRLPALDDRGIAAVTVAHESARIGDAESTLLTGVISRANITARHQGARGGLLLKAWLKMLGP